MNESSVYTTRCVKEDAHTVTHIEHKCSPVAGVQTNGTKQFPQTAAAGNMRALCRPGKYRDQSLQSPGLEIDPRTWTQAVLHAVS